MIKCIVCDLDGTLIRFNDTIEDRTYEMLLDCMNKGIEFIIATGRDINMVVDILEKYQIDCDLILNNGAQYCNRQQTFNEIYPMDNDAFIKIATILNDYGYLLAIHTNQGKYSFFDKETFWNYHYELLTKLHHSELPKKTFTTREGYLRDLHYAKNAQEIVDKGIKVLKIDARHKDAYSIQGVRDQLNIDHLNISSSFEDNIEITSDTSNKGLLLEKIIRQKGYQKDEVAVFGDGENDAPMLQNFTYSFVPKGASIHAIKAASYNLSLTCEDGAVYEGLNILKNMKLI